MQGFFAPEGAEVPGFKTDPYTCTIDESRNAEADLQPVECNRQWKSFSIHWPLCYFFLTQLLFFFQLFFSTREKPFLSLSGHERIKTLLADELSACAPRCTAAMNHQLFTPLPLVLVWKLNWDLDLFGFIISADSKPPCDHGNVGRICNSSLEIIGKKKVDFCKAVCL